MCDERAGSAGDNTMGRLIHTLGGFLLKISTAATGAATNPSQSPQLLLWRYPHSLLSEIKYFKNILLQAASEKTQI